MTLKSTIEKVRNADLKIKELTKIENELLEEKNKICDKLKQIGLSKKSFLEEKVSMQNKLKVAIDRIKNNVNQFLSASKLTCRISEDLSSIEIIEIKTDSTTSLICVLDIQDGKLMINVDSGINLPENQQGQVFFISALSRILSINI